VSASGKIQPKRFVNISADTSGRVVDLAVNEGDRVALGQFLMQIDPRTLRSRVESGQAALRGAESALDQARQGVETARVQLQVAQQNLKRQQELWKMQLTPRETLERAENDVRLAQSALVEREKQVRAGGAPRAGPRTARQRPVRPQQSAHRGADCGHRDAPQHSGR
jgi:macrolide-specific efflux system membrane fusion protein